MVYGGRYLGGIQSQNLDMTNLNRSLTAANEQERMTVNAQLEPMIAQWGSFANFEAQFPDAAATYRRVNGIGPGVMLDGMTAQSEIMGQAQQRALGMDQIPQGPQGPQGPQVPQGPSPVPGVQIGPGSGGQAFGQMVNQTPRTPFPGQVPQAGQAGGLVVPPQEAPIAEASAPVAVEPQVEPQVESPRARGWIAPEDVGYANMVDDLKNLVPNDPDLVQEGQILSAQTLELVQQIRQNSTPEQIEQLRQQIKADSQIPVTGIPFDAEARQAGLATSPEDSARSTPAPTAAPAVPQAPSVQAPVTPNRSASIYTALNQGGPVARDAVNEHIRSAESYQTALAYVKEQPGETPWAKFNNAFPELAGISETAFNNSSTQEWEALVRNTTSAARNSTDPRVRALASDFTTLLPQIRSQIMAEVEKPGEMARWITQGTTVQPQATGPGPAQAPTQAPTPAPTQAQVSQTQAQPGQVPEQIPERSGSSIWNERTPAPTPMAAQAQRRIDEIDQQLARHDEAPRLDQDGNASPEWLSRSQLQKLRAEKNELIRHESVFKLNPELAADREQWSSMSREEKNINQEAMAENVAQAVRPEAQEAVRSLGRVHSTADTRRIVQQMGAPLYRDQLRANGGTQVARQETQATVSGLLDRFLEAAANPDSPDGPLLNLVAPGLMSNEQERRRIDAEIKRIQVATSVSETQASILSQTMNTEIARINAQNREQTGAAEMTFTVPGLDGQDARNVVGLESVRGYVEAVVMLHQLNQLLLPSGEPGMSAEQHIEMSKLILAAIEKGDLPKEQQMELQAALLNMLIGTEDRVFQTTPQAWWSPVVAPFQQRQLGETNRTPGPTQNSIDRSPAAQELMRTLIGDS